MKHNLITIPMAVIILNMAAYGFSQNTKQKDYFVSASIGSSKINSSYDEIQGSFSPVLDADSHGTNFGLDIGYNINSKSFTTFSYTKIDLDDSNMYNYLFSYNYMMPYNTYIGAVAGLSYFELTKSPVPQLPIIDAKGREIALGMQAGIQYPVHKDISLFTQMQYLYTNHKTHIGYANAKAEAMRDDVINLSIGIKYSFDL